LRTSTKKFAFYPVILFDGRMAECNIIKGDIIINEIDYVTYLSSGIPEEQVPVFVDVMTLNYFPKYLELVEKEFKEREF